MVQEEEKTAGSGEEEVPTPDKPADIRKALSIIPTAAALRGGEKRVRERRIRIRYDESLKPEEARIHPDLARELGITDKLEIVVAGRHRFIFRAIIDEEAPRDRVLVPGDLMMEHGVANESIATVRSYTGTERLGVRLSV